MTWSSHKPTTEGWFWYREKGISAIVRVKADLLYIDHPLRAECFDPLPQGNWIKVDDLTGQWSGPLEEPDETKSHISRGCLYLHRRGIEMTDAQLLSAETLSQDIIVRKLADAGKTTLASDREFFQKLREGTLPL